MMLEYVFGFKSSWRIFELFSEAPLKSLSKKEIRHHTKLGNQAINECLKRFEQTEICIKHKSGKKESYYLNLQNEFTKSILKIITNERTSLKGIPFEEVAVLAEFLRKTTEKTNFIHSIFLFGSVAKGTAKINSDIDLAIITNKHNTKQELSLNLVSDAITKQYGRKIQTHQFTISEFEKNNSSLLKEIKTDGIMLF